MSQIVTCYDDTHEIETQCEIRDDTDTSSWVMISNLASHLSRSLINSLTEYSKEHYYYMYIQ